MSDERKDEDVAQPLDDERLVTGTAGLSAEVAHALALLERGQLEDARGALGALLEQLGGSAETELEAASRQPAAFGPMVDDDEIALAFESAQSHPEQMVDVNEIAERALEVVDATSSEDALLPESSAGFEISHHPTFATRTMAELLEAQGDRAGADAIRHVIARPPIDAAVVPVELETAPDSFEAAHRGRVLATLERWLQNIQRGVQ